MDQTLLGPRSWQAVTVNDHRDPDQLVEQITDIAETHGIHLISLQREVLRALVTGAPFTYPRNSGRTAVARALELANADPHTPQHGATRSGVALDETITWPAAMVWP